jgi:hypothetical protein
MGDGSSYDVDDKKTGSESSGKGTESHAVKPGSNLPAGVDAGALDVYRPQAQGQGQANRPTDNTGTTTGGSSGTTNRPNNIFDMTGGQIGGDSQQGGGSPEALQKQAGDNYIPPGSKQEASNRLEEFNRQVDMQTKVPIIKTNPDGSVSVTNVDSGARTTWSPGGGSATESMNVNNYSSKKVEGGPAGTPEAIKGQPKAEASNVVADNVPKPAQQTNDSTQSKIPSANDFYQSFKNAPAEEQKKMVQDLRSSGLSKQEATQFVSDVAKMAKQDTNGGDQVLRQFKDQVTARPETPVAQNNQPQNQRDVAPTVAQPQRPVEQAVVQPPPRPKEEVAQTPPVPMVGRPGSEAQPTGQPGRSGPGGPEGVIGTPGGGPAGPGGPTRGLEAGGHGPGGKGDLQQQIDQQGGFPGRKGAQVPDGGGIGLGLTGGRPGDKEGIGPAGRPGDKDGIGPAGPSKGDLGGQPGRPGEQGGTGIRPPGADGQIGPGKLGDGTGKPGDQPLKGGDGVARFGPFDLSDRNSRLQLLGLLKDFESGKPLDGKALGLDDKGLSRLQDFLKGLNPKEFEQLRNLLAQGPDGDKLGKFLSDPILGKLKESLVPGKEGGSGDLANLLKGGHLDFGDKNTRNSVLGLLKDFETGKPFDGKTLGLDDKSAARLQDFLKGLSPKEMEQLKSLLTQGADGDRISKFSKLDDPVLAKLRDILESGRERTVTGLNAEHLHRSAADRLADFLTSKQMMVGKDGEVRPMSMAALRELGAIVKDFNKEFGLEPGKGALTLKDILSGNLQATLMAQDKAGALDQGRFLAKLPPGQEEAFKSVLEKMVNQGAIATLQRTAALDGRDTRGGDLIKADGQVRDSSVQAQRAVDAAVAQAKGLQTQADIQAQNDLLTQINQQTPLDTRSEEEKLEALRQIKLKAETDEEKLLDDEQRRQRELALLALKELEEKERREKEEQDKQKQLEEQAKKKLDDRRQKYTVREKDTLESIASRMLSDSGLSGLIYELNSNVIPVRKVNGKKLLDLQPKLVLWLPSPADVKDYRERPFVFSQKFEYVQNQEFASVEDELKAVLGANWAGDGSREPSLKESADLNLEGEAPGQLPDEHTAETLAVAQSRRANVEKMLGAVESKPEQKDGRAKYVVRLGDTLKSIAMRHPVLGDVALWKLVAEVNGLPTTTDSKGSPTAALKRGSSIVVPNVQEIEDYREKYQIKKPVVKPATKPSDAKSPANDSAKSRDASGGNLNFEPYDADEDVTKVVLEAAGLLPKSKPVDKAPAPWLKLSGKKEEKQAEPAGPPEVSKTTSMPVEAPSDAAVLTKELSDAVRLVISDGKPGADLGFSSRLEIQHEGRWHPVITYEVYSDLALRHEFTVDGKKRTIRIDLPPSSVRELAENDVTNNWSRYCERFLSGQSISD